MATGGSTDLFTGLTPRQPRLRSTFRPWLPTVRYTSVSVISWTTPDFTPLVRRLRQTWRTPRCRKLVVAIFIRAASRVYGSLIRNFGSRNSHIPPSASSLSREPSRA